MEKKINTSLHLLTVFIYSSNQILKHYETRPQVIVFIKDGTTDEQIASLKTELEGDTRLKNVVHITKEEALEIVKDIDIDDTLFVACALAFPNSIIWSDDKKLKEQNKINILNTKEIMDLFEI